MQSKNNTKQDSVKISTESSGVTFVISPRESQNGVEPQALGDYTNISSSVWFYFGEKQALTRKNGLT